jgi:hypothetical protein
MEWDVLVKRVAADIEAAVPGAFDLTGLRTVVDVRAPAVKELGQGSGRLFMIVDMCRESHVAR